MGLTPAPNPKWVPLLLPLTGPPLLGEKVPAELVPTNGYDFTNDVQGDTYVFLLGQADPRPNRRTHTY